VLVPAGVRSQELCDDRVDHGRVQSHDAPVEGTPLLVFRTIPDVARSRDPHVGGAGDGIEQQITQRKRPGLGLRIAEALAGVGGLTVDLRQERQFAVAQALLQRRLRAQVPECP